MVILLIEIAKIELHVDFKTYELSNIIKVHTVQWNLILMDLIL